MRENYPIISKWREAYEGGFVDHPEDPGGATNYGVTQRVYDNFRDSHGVERRSVRYITDTEVDEIYRQQYWNPILGDQLPSGVDLAVHDYAVNSGVPKAVKDLQRILGVTVDGHLGIITLAESKKRDPKQLITQLCQARMAFLKRLKHWKHFGRGWTRRVMGDVDGAQPGRDIGVIDRGWQLANNVPATAIPEPTLTSDLNDGANAKGVGEPTKKAHALSMLTDKLSLSSGGGAGAAAVLAAMSEPPLSWAAAIAVLAIVGVLIWMIVNDDK